MTTIREILNRWQGSLQTSMFAGAEGLGAYLDRADLTLVKVGKNFSGINPEQPLRLTYDPDNPEGLLAGLRETVAAWDAAASPVYLAISPELGFLQPGRLPAAAAENLPQVVAYEFDRFIPLPATQVYYDFQVVTVTEAEIHLMLLGVPRARVEPLLLLLREAQLKPVGLTLAPIAAAQAFDWQAEKKKTALRLLMRTRPDGFELTAFDGAATRNFFHQRGLSRQDLLAAIQGRLTGLAEAAGENTTLCVYGEPRGDVVQKLVQKFGFRVITAAETLPAEIAGASDAGRSLTAYGAAILSLGKSVAGANLLPAAEREQVSYKTFSLHRSLIISLLILVLIWAGSALVHKRFRLFQVNRQIAQLAPEAKEVEKHIKEGQELARQMQALQTIGASPDKLVLLKNLTQLIPNNTWLYSVRLSKQVLEISGTSQSASELIPLLEKSGWLKKTEFVSPIVTDANRNEQFKIKAEIKGLDPAS